VRFFDINYNFTSIFGYSLSYSEFIATLFGLLSIWLATKQNIWTWPMGLVSVFFSFFVFYQVHLYSDMFLQIYFFITNIYGWLVWKNQFNDNRPVSTLSRKTRIQISILIIFSTLIFGILVKNIHLLLPTVFDHPASFPFIDTFIAIASIVGTMLLAKRITDSWTLWLIVDIICVFVYAFKNILFFSLEYAIFCLLACLGLLSWRQSIKHQRT
jgi:nicotinamide mononucleotide transporter